jgi:hypothetical protein
MSKKSKSGLNIREWVRDRVIFLAVMIFLAGATVYIGSEKIFGHESIWLHPVREFALLISLIGVVSLGYELFLREMTFREYKDALREIVNPDAVRLGIQGIYKNRSELGQAQSFDSLFKEVKREIFIGGSSLLSISTASRDLLKEKIREGVTVKLLLMNPDSPVVELITKQGGGKNTFLNEIKTSLLLLQKIQYELESEGGPPPKGKLLVHTYDSIPSHSFISIDAGDRRSEIIADIGPYLGRSTPRPSMLVVNKRDGMYGYWREMNDLMWQSSRAVDLQSAVPWSAKTGTLVLNSNTHTEYFEVAADRWQPASICEMDSSWKGIKGSQWIWVRESVTLEEAKTGSQNRFRQVFSIPPGKHNSIIRAQLFLRSENTCHITVNDVGLNQEYGGADYPDPFVIDIAKFLKGGENTVFFELINFARPDAQAPGDNRTGLIYRLHLEYSA